MCPSLRHHRRRHVTLPISVVVPQTVATGIEIEEVHKAFWLNSDKGLENSNVYREI